MMAKKHNYAPSPRFFCAVPAHPTVFLPPPSDRLPPPPANPPRRKKRNAITAFLKSHLYSSPHRQASKITLETGSQDNCTVTLIAAAFVRILTDRLGIVTVIIELAAADTASIVLGIGKNGVIVIRIILQHNQVSPSSFCFSIWRFLNLVYLL